jgi:hypothetical protein
VDTDEKNAELFQKGLSAQLHDPVPRPDVQCPSECGHQPRVYHLSMFGRGGGEEEEEGHVKTFWRWFSGCSTRVPPSLHTTCGTVASSSTTVVGPSPVVPVVVPAAVVPLCSHLPTAGSTIMGTIAAYASWLPVLQLWEDWSFHQGLPHGQVGLLTESCGTKGEPAEGPSTMDWSRQLHRPGGDPHQR